MAYDPKQYADMRRGIKADQIRATYKAAETAALDAGATPAEARKRGLMAVSNLRWSTFPAARRTLSATARVGLQVIDGGKL